MVNNAIKVYRNLIMVICLIIFSRSSVVFGEEMPEFSVKIGNNVFLLNYANDVKNQDEVSAAVRNTKGGIYIQTSLENWINNSTGKSATHEEIFDVEILRVNGVYIGLEDSDPEPVIKPVVIKIDKKGYTYQSIRNEILKKNTNPFLTEISGGEDDIPYTALHYNTNNNLGGHYYDVFDMNSLEGKTPNMDFGWFMYGMNDRDPVKIKSALAAIDMICEIIFPKEGEKLYKAMDTVKQRHVTIGNMGDDFPTVYFIGGRRIYITPRSSFTSGEFSVVNDKSDIWKELDYITDGFSSKYTKAELKKIMPELKNY